jgi:CMP-N,N'-diacetyllegionaminic acid synthase
MRAYALILARSGSKGVPDKNVRPIGGHPLLAYSIAFAQKLNVERIIVSTDSPRYHSMAVAYGAECPYLRGAKASSDTALDEEILEDLAQNLPPLGIALPAAWVRLKPTCPFRSTDSVHQALAALAADPSIDSVRIVSAADARLDVVNAEGFLEPLLPNWNPTRSVLLRSEVPRAYQPFNLQVFRHSGWVERGSLFMGRRIKPIVEHKITGFDIDDEDDLLIVKALIEMRPRPDFLARFIHDPEIGPFEA